MKEKIRLFLISNLAAASLLTSACVVQAPPQGATQPGAQESTQLEATTQVEESVGAVATDETVGETEGMAAATTEAAGETQEVAGAAATTEAPGETEGMAAATTEAPGEAQEVAGAAATTEAAGETQEVVEAEATQTVGETGSEMAGVELPAAKASTLIGHVIRGPQGEELAKIEDLVIGGDSNQIKYAVLSFGNLPMMANKFFAIPLNAFHFDPEQNMFMLDAPITQLITAPSFDLNNWPDMTDPEWDAELREFWQDTMETAETAQAETGQEHAALTGESAVRASELLNFNVENAQSEQVGQVEDIVIQLDTGAIQNVVLSFADNVDSSGNFFGLPLGQVKVSPENDRLIFELDQDMLQNIPSFTPDEWQKQFNLELGQANQ